MTQKGISLVVCCHNSALRLPKTIKHIALQQVSGHIPWEVIVIDNILDDFLFCQEDYTGNPQIVDLSARFY